MYNKTAADKAFHYLVLR